MFLLPLCPQKAVLPLMVWVFLLPWLPRGSSKQNWANGHNGQMNCRESDQFELMLGTGAERPRGSRAAWKGEGDHVRASDGSGGVGSCGGWGCQENGTERKCQDRLRISNWIPFDSL